ncbi:MAG: hypothetical protein ACK2UU_10735 [Anaerolineae bacterium]
MPEAAEILNSHPNHLSRLLREGRVQGEWVGGRWMVSHQEGERVKSLQGPGGRLPKTVPEP